MLITLRETLSDDFWYVFGQDIEGKDGVRTRASLERPS
jgi:hypothetical protein